MIEMPVCLGIAPDTGKAACARHLRRRSADSDGGVNVAARIEPHAEPGGVGISEPVFEMVRKKLQLDVSKVEGATLKYIAVAPDLYRIRLGS